MGRASRRKGSPRRRRCRPLCCAALLAVLGGFFLTTFSHLHKRLAAAAATAAVPAVVDAPPPDARLLRAALRVVSDAPTAVPMVAADPVLRAAAVRASVVASPTPPPTPAPTSPPTGHGSPGGSVPEGSVSFDVHIFYYPWYANVLHDHQYWHWNHPLLPHWDKAVAARYECARSHRPALPRFGLAFHCAHFPFPLPLPV